MVDYSHIRSILLGGMKKSSRMGGQIALDDCPTAAPTGRPAVSIVLLPAIKPLVECQVHAVTGG